MEIAVADTQKNPAVQFVTETQSVRLTNFSIRVLWKSTAGVIAVTARLFTAIILAVIGVVQRNRTNW